MGWAGGSRLFSEIIHASKKAIPDIFRKNFYLEIIKAFEGEDWDTQDECEGLDLAYDEALAELHPREKSRGNNGY